MGNIDSWKIAINAFTQNSHFINNNGKQEETNDEKSLYNVLNGTYYSNNINKLFENQAIIEKDFQNENPNNNKLNSDKDVINIDEEKSNPNENSIEVYEEKPNQNEALIKISENAKNNFLTNLIGDHRLGNAGKITKFTTFNFGAGQLDCFIAPQILATINNNKKIVIKNSANQVVYININEAEKQNLEFQEGITYIRLQNNFNRLGQASGHFSRLQKWDAGKVSNNSESNVHNEIK